MVKACSTVLERILACVMYFIVTAIITKDYMSLKQMELAEDITASFIKKICAAGRLNANDYDKFTTSLAKLGGHNIKMSYTVYVKEPYYGLYSETEIASFFSNRNIREEKNVSSSRPTVRVESLEDLSLQSESNTHVMERFLNSNITAVLPQDEYYHPFVYSAALPAQEVYVGEQLVTMLITEANGITYYKEADVLYATQSGSYQAEITIGGEGTGAFINVKAWDKTATCDKGHNYPCTKRVIDEIKLSGQANFCPYCELYIEKFIVAPNEISIPIETDVSDIPVTITALYMDGHTDQISFSMTDNDYDKNYAGEQYVSFSYGGVEAIVTIHTSIPNCSKCGEEIQNRSCSDYKMYSLCNKCLQSVPIYIGTYTTIPYIKTNKEIKDALIENGAFIMGRGGLFTVEVVQIGNHGKTLLSPTGNPHSYFMTGDTIKKNGN